MSIVIENKRETEKKRHFPILWKYENPACSLSFKTLFLQNLIKDKIGQKNVAGSIFLITLELMKT